jgi:hypothetical protein
MYGVTTLFSWQINNIISRSITVYHELSFTLRMVDLRSSQRPCKSVSSGRCSLTFRWNILPWSLGLKNERSKQTDIGGKKIEARLAFLANSWTPKIGAICNSEMSVNIYRCGAQPYHLPLSTGQEYDVPLGQVYWYSSFKLGNYKVHRILVFKFKNNILSWFQGQDIPLMAHVSRCEYQWATWIIEKFLLIKWSPPKYLNLILLSFITT